MNGTSIDGPAIIRNPANHPPVAEQEQWVFREAWLSPAVLAVQTPEAEDEFERARR